jgi:hypothetical protein
MRNHSNQSVLSNDALDWLRQELNLVFTGSAQNDYATISNFGSGLVISSKPTHGKFSIIGPDHERKLRAALEYHLLGKFPIDWSEIDRKSNSIDDMPRLSFIWNIVTFGGVTHQRKAEIDRLTEQRIQEARNKIAELKSQYQEGELWQPFASLEDLNSHMTRSISLSAVPGFSEAISIPCGLANMAIETKMRLDSIANDIKFMVVDYREYQSIESKYAANLQQAQQADFVEVGYDRRL